MRPVVLQMGLTLDGFVHGAKGYEDWGLPPEDDEIIEWLHTPDETLPVEGAPIDAMMAGHKTEIRRRAQELAF